MNKTISKLRLQKAFLLHKIENLAPFQLPTDEQLIELGRIQLGISLEQKNLLNTNKNTFDED